jgi:hypothetical protein
LLKNFQKFDQENQVLTEQAGGFRVRNPDKNNDNNT